MGKYQKWEYIAYGNGKFVAISEEGNVGISTDGLNWTAHSLPGDHMWTGIAYGSGNL